MASIVSAQSGIQVRNIAVRGVSKGGYGVQPEHLPSNATQTFSIVSLHTVRVDRLLTTPA